VVVALVAPLRVTTDPAPLDAGLIVPEIVYSVAVPPSPVPLPPQPVSPATTRRDVHALRTIKERRVYKVPPLAASYERMLSTDCESVHISPSE